MEMQPLVQRNTHFQRTLEAGVSHLTSLMAIHRLQRKECGSCTRTLITTGVGSPRRCKPWSRHWKFKRRRSKLVRSCRRCHEVPAIASASSLVQGLRTVEEITGLVDAVEAGPTVEEKCPAQRNAYESGHSYFEESTGLPLDPKMVADAVQEELTYKPNE